MQSLPPAYFDPPRTYPTWVCNRCGHKVARDLIDPKPPKRCRGKPLNCTGRYVPDTLFDYGTRPWRAGEREACERLLKRRVVLDQIKGMKKR
jgi:hypothetical protein